MIKLFDRLINKVVREGLNSIKEIIYNSKANFFLKKIDHYLFRSNESKIINILSKLKKNRIILLTSHKKSIIDRCDVKYEIENKIFNKI